MRTALAATLTLSLILPACNDPQAAKTAVAAVDAGLPLVCPLVGVASGNQAVGAVCSDVEPVVKGVVDGVVASLPQAAVPTPPKDQAFVGVSFRGKPVGYFRPDAAKLITAKLQALP